MASSGKDGIERSSPPGAAVVTGASGGIGRAICQELAGAGRPLVLTYRSDETGAKETAARASEAGAPEVMVRRMDVRDPDEVGAVMNEAARHFGGIDVLVNNAAVGQAGAVLPTSHLEDWTDAVDVNLVGTFHCIRAVSMHMLVAGRGAIVTIASIAGLTGIAGLSSYCAGKAGVIGMTRSLSREFGPRGVRVNVVAPGYIADTAMITRIDDERLSAFVGRTALGRLGAPEDVAAAVAYLASDDARFVTGHTLVVDGGLTT